MEKKFKRTLVTSALPYANGPVHIGHLAGVYVPADIYVLGELGYEVGIVAIVGTANSDVGFATAIHYIKYVGLNKTCLSGSGQAEHNFS